MSPADGQTRQFPALSSERQGWRDPAIAALRAAYDTVPVTGHRTRDSWCIAVGQVVGRTGRAVRARLILLGLPLKRDESALSICRDCGLYRHPAWHRTERRWRPRCKCQPPEPAREQKVVIARLSVAEHGLVRRHARQAGLSASEWVRRAVATALASERGK